MNINALFVNIDFLYYSGSVKEMNISAAKNAGNRNQLNNFLLSHLPVVVNVVQSQALLLQVVLRERGQVVKPSKTGCFTRILKGVQNLGFAVGAADNPDARCEIKDFAAKPRFCTPEISL